MKTSRWYNVIISRKVDLLLRKVLPWYSPMSLKSILGCFMRCWAHVTSPVLVLRLELGPPSLLWCCHCCCHRAHPALAELPWSLGTSGSCEQWIDTWWEVVWGRSGERNRSTGTAGLPSARGVGQGWNGNTASGFVLLTPSVLGSEP